MTSRKGKKLFKIQFSKRIGPNGFTGLLLEYFTYKIRGSESTYEMESLARNGWLPSKKEAKRDFVTGIRDRRHDYEAEIKHMDEVLMLAEGEIEEFPHRTR